ncbi:MAG: crossover junction endodeoxyribonuclease RuvC [Planctomycetota bacterium]|nr:MAG: crossover junction endodeoxyribonuclease RuvC [Planctomycetota bacterium]REK27600.1 MAG: crossover junction endodeoxyribonuclease RuvC [Planctomycetota bacterium]
MSADVRGEVCLGIDPGLNRTGYAILSRFGGSVSLTEGGVVSSTSSRSLAERVHEIGTGLREVLEEFQPRCVAIEQVFSLGKNPKTALLMAHARGAILYAVADHGIDLKHYTPRQIKKLLTGSGTASKEQVQRAVTRELALDAVPEPNDVADACAVALCHLHSSRVITATE